MEARSECPVTWEVTSRSSAYNLHSAFRYLGVAVQRQIYGVHTQQTYPRSFHSPLPFLVILGFPCLSLAYRPSPLRCRYEFYEPNAEESRSIKVTLSALPKSLRPHPCPFVRTMDRSFKVPKKRNHAIKSLV